MPGCVRLVRRRCERRQGVIPEDRRLDPFPVFGKFPPRRVRPRRRRLSAPHRALQRVVRGVEMFEHLVHGRCGYGPVGVLLGGAQPWRQGGFVLRGADRRRQAALDGRGLGVIREVAALCVAVGGGHRHVPCGMEEAQQGWADREVVRSDHLGLRHAASPDALPQGPWQEGLVYQDGVPPVSGRMERAGHVLQAARRGPLETKGLPARAEVLRGQVGGGIHVDVNVAGDDHRVPPTEAGRRGIHLYVSAERCPCRRGVHPACGTRTLIRVRPPLSVQISRAPAIPGTSFLKLSTSCSARYLLLTALRRPPRLEVEVDPVSASQLLKKGVSRFSRSAAATCISCARMTIPVSRSMMAKPPSWGSMPVMRCSLSMQATRRRRRQTVSRWDQSRGTRPLRRFQVRSPTAPPASSS